MRRQGSPRPWRAGSAPAAERSLDALFEPRSITVVGASDDDAKWGNTLSRRALTSCGGRPVLLVNRRGVEVLGQRTHRTLTDARTWYGESLDLVVVCVPAAQLVRSVTEALAGGARSLVVISAGLSELGDTGAVVEREAVRLARAAGAVLVGPNCLGLVDTSTDLQLSHDVLPPGGVTVLSQSGNVVLDLADLLQGRGLGVARFVSVGNQADLSVVDLLVSCLHHAPTRAVAIYAEDFADGRAFVAASRALEAAGKPVVLLAPGRSAAAVRGAASHTGSLTSASGVVDAACAASGTHRVDNPTQMADLLQGLLAGRRMLGRRTAILTDGGGHGAIAGDALAAVGLETPVLADETRASLRGRLRQNSTVSNPVDLAGAGERDPMTYTQTLATLLLADEVDGVLVTGYFGGYSTLTSALASRETAAARVMIDIVLGQAKPVVVHTLHPDGPTGLLLHTAGIPVHREVDRAADVLSGLLRQPVGGGDSLDLPLAAAPVTDTSYDGARRLFAEAGVSFPAARTIRDHAGLEAALEAAVTAGEMSFPLVLKALGRLHKSEAGGVVLGIGDPDEARRAYADLRAGFGAVTVSVESMVDTSRGVEVIVGCVRDPRFGPVLMVGLGGILAEVLADTALALAPLSPTRARALLLTLRGAPVLLGTRGREPVDLVALATAVSRVSHVAAAHPELVELELNPLLAGPTGTLALDARVVGDAPAQSPATSPR